MIRLFTGLPGAGKTNHALSDAMKDIAKGRPVYFANVNGLELEGAIPFDDPTKWEELPAGSLLLVDEAQRFWRATRALDVPPEVQAMETHRHLGIDFILTTQQPNYLLKHLRGLVGEHVHHKRLAKGGAQTWKWNRVSDDPMSATEQELAETGMYVFNQAAFTKYKSTEEDTHKPKLSKKVKFLIIGGIAVALFAIALPRLLKRAGETNKEKETATEASPAQPPTRGAASARGREQPPRTTAEYVAWLTPRVAGSMWSAPAFDKEVMSSPEIYCASSGDGIDANGDWSKGSCDCISEQGTRMVLDQQTCHATVKNGGVYNPFRMPQHQMQQPQLQEPVNTEAAPLQPVQVPRAHGGEYQIATYGAMRNKEYPAIGFDGFK